MSNDMGGSKIGRKHADVILAWSVIQYTCFAEHSQLPVLHFRWAFSQRRLVWQMPTFLFNLREVTWVSKKKLEDFIFQNVAYTPTLFKTEVFYVFLL